MTDLTTVSTAGLQAELLRREGVTLYTVDNEGTAELMVRSRGRVNYVEFDGPAVITVSTD